MEHILEVNRVYKDQDGHPRENVPLGYIVNDDTTLFPYLKRNVNEATVFASYDDAIDFMGQFTSELMASKNADDKEYTVSAYEYEIHLEQA